MPDSFDATGLKVKTLPEIVADLTSGLQAIYGVDINVDQNSPDGQLINIVAQAAADIRELAVQINNGFDPDRAIGSILDERVVINNIARRGGTFTIQPIEITTSATVTLQGLDASFNDPDGTGYTVQDDTGTQFVLIDTATLTAGTTTKNFRAKNIGRVETTVDTIQNPVTIILGVTGINNSNAPLSIGENQETDSQLRIRRQKSTENGNFNYLNGLLGFILDLDGVSSAKLYENVGNSIDVHGVPAHGIWLIVEDGANADIANAIYNKKSYGADMKGAVVVPITTASGAIFNAKFDRPAAKNLHIRFDIQPTVAIPSLDTTAIKTYIEDNLTYEISDFAETSRITAVALAAILATGSGGVPVNMEISKDGAVWVDFLEVDTLNEQWAVSTARITVTVL